MYKRTFNEKAVAFLLWLIVLGSIASLFFCFDHIYQYSAILPWQGYFFAGISAFVLLYILYGAVGAAIYREAPQQDDKTIPGCTVIVPAYNEGKHVAETLQSLLESDFPHEKLEIIAINDGSKDDTMEWIRSVEKISQGKVISLDLPENKGKKHALYRGFHLAKYDIVVTVDSDSIVTKESIRNIVSAFYDPAVGAVAGNIRIKNLSDGMIPKMMDVGFMFGFELIRTCQSLTGLVMCTPGALSAYRKSMIMPFIDQWLHQMFLGAAASIGEDRALASMILQHGHKVTFQRNAIAATCIPHTYARFCKMMLRWLRSDVRENILMTFHFLKTFRFNFFYAGYAMHLGALIVSTVMPVVSVPIFVDMCMRFTITELLCALYFGAVMGFVGAMIPALIYAKRISVLDAVWAPVYSFYSIFLTGWIPVYAFFTARNSNWLTREIKTQKRNKKNRSLHRNEQTDPVRSKDSQHNFV